MGRILFRLKWCLHIVKCRIYSEVEGKDKIFATKWDSLCKHASQKKVERNIGTNVKRGIDIILKIAGMLRTISYLLLATMEMLLPNLQMEWQERIEERLSNLPLSFICYSKVVPCKNMKQLGHYMNSWQCQKIARSTGVITLVGQWKNSCIRK